MYIIIITYCEKINSAKDIHIHIITIIIIEIQAKYHDYTFGLDYATVFDGIGLFGKTLKELFIDGPCTYYFSLNTLLHFLPALTHLTIKLTYMSSIIPFEQGESFDEGIQRDIQSDNDDNNNNDDDDEIYNFVFLSLDSEYWRNTPIKRIIKRSPRLKYLLASRTALKEREELSRVDLASILELCPSIHYVHWGEYIITKKIEK